jgi:DNA modification methylase
MDPVVCELVLRWFAQPGYKAFDPFSGDCSFGFVASALGMDFRGIELRQEQVDGNVLTLRSNGLEGEYICDDALNLEKHIEPLSQDFIFSCPPYADLEKYSDDPRDLSNMSHKDFRQLLGRSLQMLYSRLRDNRFAVIVISDVRSEGGGYMRLPQFVAEEMCDSGFALWNEIILINAVSTLGLRASRQMQATRKVGRTHQLVLVFYKGDQAQIKPTFGDVWRLPGQEAEEDAADPAEAQAGNGAEPEA